MIFAQSLVAAASLASAVTAMPWTSHFGGVNFGNNVAEKLTKRDGFLAITGAVGLGDGDIHPRLEISDLATRADQWSLFILAMQQFQAGAQSEREGYYQIAGIHGVPRQDWDGVEQCSSCSSADGYCTHDSVLFPAWHRVYMSLFEQEFLNIALDIANSYPDASRARMVAAQATLRFPYWDWAAKPDSGSVLPTSISSNTITVAGPSGTETITNPLYSYHFSDPSDLYYGTFTSWPNTLRWPNSDNVTAVSQEASAISAFDNIRSSMQDQVYQLLTVCNDYLHFSNDDAGSSSSACSTSLEAIHNTIHTTAGGPGSSSVLAGHMTYLSLASFDPIFWLHHCNVDRLFALWQTVNPDSYGAAQVAPHSTWTIASGSTQDGNSPLEPFHKNTDGDFWTTNQVEDWANTFHYTYPEFSTSDGSRAAIISYINSLYGPSSTATAGSISALVVSNDTTSASSSSSSSSQSSTSTTTTDASSTVSDTPLTTLAGAAVTKNSSSTVTAGGVSSGVSSRLFSNTSTATVDPTATTFTLPATIATPSVLTNTSFTTANNDSTYQYVCNLNTPRYALNGSYSVYVFDGTPSSEDTTTWLTSSNLIGVFGVLAMEGMSSSNTLVAGSIPLTRTLQQLVKDGKIPSMAEDDCVPYLTANLNWRVAKDGSEVDIDTLDGFKASVYSSTTTTSYAVDVLPEWSDFVPQIQVTENKAGGAVVADTLDTYSGSSSSSSGSGSSSSGSGSGSSSGSSSSAAGSGNAPAAVTVYVEATETIYACAATSASLFAY